MISGSRMGISACALISIPYKSSYRLTWRLKWEKEKKKRKNAGWQTSLVLPSLQIYGTYQRLFDENEASLSIAILSAKLLTRSYCMNWSHPHLSCNPAAVCPSVTVSGPWNTACVINGNQKWARWKSLYMSGIFGAPMKKTYSNQLWIFRTSVSHLFNIINQQSQMI